MLSDNLTPMVLRVLAREGKTVMLVQPARQEELTYDPSTGETSVVADSTCSVKAVVLDFALVSNGMQSKAGTTITIDDKECYLSPLDVNGAAFPKTLRPNDKILFGSETWNILTIKEYNPSGSSPIMYKLLIKR